MLGNPRARWRFRGLGLPSGDAARLHRAGLDPEFVSEVGVYVPPSGLAEVLLARPQGGAGDRPPPALALQRWWLASGTVPPFVPAYHVIHIATTLPAAAALMATPEQLFAEDGQTSRTASRAEELAAARHPNHAPAGSLGGAWLHTLLFGWIEGTGGAEGAGLRQLDLGSFLEECERRPVALPYLLRARAEGMAGRDLFRMAHAGASELAALARAEVPPEWALASLRGS